MEATVRITAMATVVRLTLTATGTRATPGVEQVGVGAEQVGVGAEQVIGVEPGSPLGLSSDAASSPLELSSDAAPSSLDLSSDAGPSPLDLSSDAGPSHPFGVCGVLGAKRRIGVRLSN
jgi:hypothetical protein